MTYTRALLTVSVRSWRLLVPLTATAFAILGVYAYRPNDVQGSFAVTTVLAAISCAWLVAATERGLDASAAAIMTVASGGAAQTWRARLAFTAITAVAVGAAFIAWPTLTGAFDRSPGAGDIAAAALAHAASGALGGCLALVLAPPVRAASAFAGTLAVVLASIALSEALGPLAGIGGVALALSESPDNGVSLALAVAAAVTLAQAGALAFAARRLARWRG